MKLEVNPISNANGVNLAFSPSNATISTTSVMKLLLKDLL